MKTRLVTATPDAEKIIAYCARVSNPKNQDNEKISGLLRFCIQNGHWSIFETCNMLVEIETTRAIAAQILRHRSFSFQEFSQRYADVSQLGFDIPEARRQDTKNRQNSIDDLPVETQEWFRKESERLGNDAFEVYNQALEKGIAKECARFLLPLNTKSRLYMNGTIRSWIHYLELRGDPKHGTQLEHLKIAQEIKEIFIDVLPETSKALGWVREG